MSAAPAAAPGPAPAPVAASEKLQPREYPQLLRGPRHRWWRPLVGLSVMAGVTLVMFVVTAIAVVVALVAQDTDLAALEEMSPEVLVTPAMFTINNLFLASFIPASMLAVWAGHRWRPGWVSSVVPRLRWRWMLGCAAVCFGVQAVGTLVLYGVQGFPSGQADAHAVALLVSVALTTPLQCAGEEYLCRGWMTQMIGSWFRRAVLAAVVPALVTATVFAAMHSVGAEQNAALFFDRFAFGLLASYLTWRTGGLEAAIAAHTANNVVVMVPAVLTGTLDDSIGVSEVPWSLVGVDVAVMVVVGLLLLALARRVRVQRRHDPDRQPQERRLSWEQGGWPPGPPPGQQPPGPHQQGPWQPVAAPQGPWQQHPGTAPAPAPQAAPPPAGWTPPSGQGWVPPAGRDG